jgi:hypothetical protein
MARQQAEVDLAELRHAVDALLATQTAALPGPQLVDLLAQVETQRRRLEALDQILVAEIERQCTAYEYGRGTTAGLLTHVLRISPGEAKQRVARARDVGPRHGLTGEPLAPILPATAEAVGAGDIGPGHVAVIADALDALSPAVAHEVSGYAETFLVEAARHEHPGQLRRTAAMLIARLDPDGVEPSEDEVDRSRGFSLLKRRDGSSVPRGRFTAELTEQIETVLDSLAAPQPAGPDGERDGRTGEQRRHDGLAEALSRILRSGELPESGGVPVTILARTTMSELQQQSGVAVTNHGNQISISKLLEIASDARVIPVVCNDAGGVLAYGRERRLASKGQRFALAARDGGCCFPGCDRPAAWTEVHHALTWLDLGDTDVDNMCLLCRYHHRHFAALGWEVTMRDGVPWWRPPAWLDAERRPIRNTTHHVDDIRFGTTG